MANEAPYRQSRAFLREKYGSRVIDGSAPQSPLDQTPSGRTANALRRGRAENPNYSIQNAEDEVERQFRAQFGGSRVTPTPVANPIPSGGASAFPDRMPNAAAGFASAAPTTPLTTVGGGPAMPAARTGRPAGWSATPIPSSSFPAAAPASFTPATPGPALTPLSYNLSDPSPVGATQLASLLPQTPLNSYVPPWRQQRQGGYMSSILNGASKYLT